MSTRPKLATLSDLSQSVKVPAYRREDLSAGIVHIGVGNFHRAHQAFYLHQLFNGGTDHDWAIIGAGIKSYDAAMRDRLEPQDWLTTVVELDPDGYKATVTGAMIDFAPVDSGSLVELLSRPAKAAISSMRAAAVLTGRMPKSGVTSTIPTTHKPFSVSSSRPWPGGGPPGPRRSR
jgi:mannitol 2-dehydrogenase